MVDVFAMFVLVVTIIPAINQIVNDVSGSLSSIELILAGLFGMFLLLRVVSYLFEARGTAQAYY